jgi:hypothetical protein
MNAIIDITDIDLMTLRDEAGRKCDFAQVALCTLALDGAAALDADDISALAEAGWDHMDTHPAAARRECERVIRAN